MGPVVNALSNLTETLAFARTQSKALEQRFFAIALTLAVQQACVAALSAYESAERQDVLDQQRRDGEERLAQVGELMRRVRSPDYLNDPERLSLPHSATKAVRALADFRNHALHPLPGAGAPPLTQANTQKALDVIDYLTLTHPAFDAGTHSIQQTFIRDHLNALRS